MKNVLVITAIALFAYGVYLNWDTNADGCKPCKKKKGMDDGGTPMTDVPEGEKNRIMRHPPVSGVALPAPENGPMPDDDVMLQHYDATPFATTVKLFARVAPGAGSIEEINTYKGDYILYQ